MPTTAPAYTRLTPEDRRSQLLDVANELFAERGYDGVSIEEIAASAGVTRGLVHHYFGAKRDVYLALLARLGGAARQAWEIPEDGGLEERVGQTLEHWLAWVADNRTIWLATAALGDEIKDAEIRGILDETRGAVLAEFAGMVPGSRTHGAPLDFALWSWLGLNQAACRGWLEGKVTQDEVHRLLTGTLVDLLGTARD